MWAVSNSAGVRTSTTHGGLDESRSFSSSAALIVAPAAAFMAFSLVKRAPMRARAVSGDPSCLPFEPAPGTDSNRRDVYVLPPLNPEHAPTSVRQDNSAIQRGQHRQVRSPRRNVRRRASETMLLSPRDAEGESLRSCCAPTN